MTPIDKMRSALRIKLEAERLFGEEVIQQFGSVDKKENDIVAELSELGASLDDLKAKSLEEKTEVAAAVADIQGQLTTLKAEFDQFKLDAVAGKVADAATIGTFVEKVADIKNSVDDLSNLPGATPPPPPPPPDQP